MIISVASGKGGTSKTLVAPSLALSLPSERPVQLLECDVDAADLYLLLKPITQEEHEFWSGRKAVIVTEPTLSGIHNMDRVIGVCHRALLMRGAGERKEG